MDRKILCNGIHSYYNVFIDSDKYIEKIEEHVSKSEISWIPSFNKKTMTEESAKKFFRNVDTIALPLESQITDAINKENEAIKTVINFSNSLNENFKPYLDDYLNHYGITVSEQEPFGLLKYGKGQKFDRHIDDGMRFVRKVSLVYYANDDYSGGEIYFDQFDVKISPQKNQLLLFPSNYIYTHSVNEVLEGTRYSIVSWYR